ncbi:MAG TPA: hypothetical protein VER76_07115 [Pyrinomonadaceae bacterium]|nr:hypothetical protein [Pyrinomonadaceae bacterium]
MRLSELIIIYLAAAAPFGVADFINRPAGVARTRALFNATRAALVWPLTLLSSPLVRKKFGRRELKAAERVASSSREIIIDDARRALLSALYRTEDLAHEVYGATCVATRDAVRTSISAVERHAGLALAVENIYEETSPAPGETELCRLAGRVGDDLHIAARCHRRRHVARLKAHQAESRLELLHALAELREVFERTHPTATDAAHATRALRAALLEAYARAIDLLSLLEDASAATSVARLLDAACARLRHQTESPAPQVAPASLVQQNRTGNVAREDEPCTTSIPQTNSQPHLPHTQTIRAHG